MPHVFNLKFFMILLLGWSKAKISLLIAKKKASFLFPIVFLHFF